jgi:oxygen-dependent protoporphyrinogen oxidase
VRRLQCDPFLVTEERHVVVVGAGIAGLTAALRLRDLKPLVLEAEDRVGGRIYSKQRGDLALSVGAHMLPPPESTVGRMASEFGVEIMPIGGSMLNIHYRGKLVRDRRPELLPFLLPLSLRGRISFARAGLRVKKAGAEYMRLIEPSPGDTDAAVRLRALRYHGEESYAEFLGNLHPEAYEIFQALANRSTAEPDEISQSAMAALFGHVWDTGDLGRNMRGGAGRLPEAVARALGPAVRLRTRVHEVVLEPGGVRVRTEAGNEFRTQTAIVTPPAPIALKVLRGLPAEVAEALGRVRTGPLVVLSVLTSETGPAPWDDLYSILTPDKSFNMFFNHANFLRTAGEPKQGSVLMVYAGGDRARRLFDLPEDDIRERFLADIESIFPTARGIVAETMVQKWPHAAPFAGPGRWRAQEALERGAGDRIFFAGDWVSEFVSMETAARTAIDAAANVRRVLGG